MARKIKVGDEVFCKTSFGTGPTKRLIVDSIDINCKGKYGEGADEVEYPKGGLGRDVNIGFTNETWAYGDQVRPIN